MTQPKINELLSQSLIRYSQVWEDETILKEALQINPEDHVLSICSAGCNALALLLAGAHKVVAVDLNPAQIALIQLKKQAILHCSLQEYRSLMGVDEPQNVLEIYQKIRTNLPRTAQEFWDGQQPIMATGIIHAGKLDNYFRVFQERVIQKLVPKKVLENYLISEDLIYQTSFFNKYFCHPNFVETFKKYTSQEMIASSGRDPQQFAFVTQKDIGSYFYDRFRYVCTKIPARHNYYLHYLLAGSYKHISPPQYRDKQFAKLKERIQDLEVRHEGLLETIDAYPKGYFTKANLSDLFEYLCEEDTRSFLNSIGKKMNSRSTIAYWNLLVLRSATERWTSHQEEADDIHTRDRCFFYSRFVKETIG